MSKVSVTELSKVSVKELSKVSVTELRFINHFFSKVLLNKTKSTADTLSIVSQ